MRDFVLMTDSCCDMAPQMAEELGLIVLPLSLELGGATYHNYLDGREIGFSDFYSRIRSGETATTSAISVGTFEEAMRPVLESGRDILCLSFSSALSTTYQSAVIAAGEMREAFPEAKDRGCWYTCAPCKSRQENLWRNCGITPKIPRDASATGLRWMISTTSSGADGSAPPRRSLAPCSPSSPCSTWTIRAG